MTAGVDGVVIGQACVFKGSFELHLESSSGVGLLLGACQKRC